MYMYILQYCIKPTIWKESQESVVDDSVVGLVEVVERPFTGSNVRGLTDIHTYSKHTCTCTVCMCGVNNNKLTTKVHFIESDNIYMTLVVQFCDVTKTTS